MKHGIRSLLAKPSPLLILAILFLAVFLRLYRLDQLPPGLHYDEAFNATMAHRVLVGVERPIFFREDLTEEPLAIYVTALSFALFGETPWAIRLVSALAGIVTVAALYLLARALFSQRGASAHPRWTAALAAFVLAILYWHVNSSRLGMEPIFTPLTMTLAFAFLWRALLVRELNSRILAAQESNSCTNKGGRKGWRWFALAGAFLGATLYTYKTALFVPIFAIVFLGIECLADRSFWVRNARGLVIFVLVAVLVFAPLGLYWVSHPAEFFERPNTVTVAPSSTTTLADNTLKVAGMFFLRGDENPRSNLPGRPALDPFLAMGFIIGVIACIVRIHRAESRFLLLWLGVMVLPSVLTDFAPHFGRSIGVAPATALTVAYGFAVLLQKAQGTKHDCAALQHSHADRLLPTVYCLLLIGLAFSTYSTVRDYFDVWSARTGLFDSFDVGYLTLAQRLRDRPADESVYLSPVDQHHYTIQFGLAGREARSFDGRHVLVLPPRGIAAAYGIITRDDTRSLARLTKIFADARAVETIRDFLGNPYATIYRVEGAARAAPQKSVNARLGNVVGLIGYDVAREGNSILLTVYWSSIAETREDYTVFAHLVAEVTSISALNPATQSPVWAQDDARPGRGSFPTSRWQPGQVVIDEYRLTILANAPQGEYQIEIGMYNLETGARLAVVDANGAPMESNRVLIERITLP